MIFSIFFAFFFTKLKKRSGGSATTRIPSCVLIWAHLRATLFSFSFFFWNNERSRTAGTGGSFWSQSGKNSVRNSVGGPPGEDVTDGGRPGPPVPVCVPVCSRCDRRKANLRVAVRSHQQSGNNGPKTRYKNPVKKKNCSTLFHTHKKKGTRQKLGKAKT